MRFFAMLLAAAMLPALSGCELFNAFANSHTEQAKPISVEIIKDPETGEITKLTHWQFPNGDMTTTTDRFKKDTPVTDRRTTGRAPVRIVD
ncbi:hypothetical protein [Dongia sedimenti]|uniref:Uncharacterized protein n=1 Tax=Dongia sedimenti TaxID=3064282 RepID=A0ABU0YMY2_9PROT|nr:hypothetical protein [Rhodospirillaceae bacterium R-7]